jgi:hypothetical protein
MNVWFRYIFSMLRDKSRDPKKRFKILNFSSIHIKPQLSMGQRKIRNFGLIILNRSPFEEGPKRADDCIGVKI